ncbi:MAG: M48 family metalloprotease [Oligoflexia bacterium]|nr:M48 family metalloprotease [Oligoflexia bacterium]
MRKLGLPTLTILLLSACEAPVPLTQVELAKNPGLSGTLRIESADPKLGNSKDLVLSATNTTDRFTFESVGTRELTLSLSYSGQANLPKSATSRAATLRATVSIGQDPDTRAVRTKLTRLELEPRLPVDCSRVIAVSAPGEGRLRIDLTAFNGLSSCLSEGRDFDKLSPLKIGERELTHSNRFSVADDVRMGNEYAAQFIAENRASILPDEHPTTVYFQRVMDRIAAASEGPAAFKPTVHVINADVLNAFALPGGQVFVFRGLVDSARSEAEVAGVLGHEWAHVTNRHGTANVTRAYRMMNALLAAEVAGYIAVVSAELRRDYYRAAVARVSTGLVQAGGVLYLLSKSREAETEADEMGSQYAWAVDYEPWGIADLFEVFLGRSGRTSRLEELLSDHPALEKRIDHVHDLSALIYPVKPAYVHTSREFEDARGALRSAPLPSSGQSIGLGNRFAAGVTAIAETKLAAYAEENQERFEKAALAVDVGKAIIDLIEAGQKKEDRGNAK